MNKLKNKESKNLHYYFISNVLTTKFAPKWCGPEWSWAGLRIKPLKSWDVWFSSDEFDSILIVENPAKIIKNNKK